MVDVVWSDNATEDYDRIVAYVAATDPRAAWRLADKLRRLADSLQSFPNRGRPVGRFHELTSAPPFVLRYRVQADTVTIVSIRHGRQAPAR